MFKRQRITRYYVIEQQKNLLFVSHQPRWLFYFAGKKKFLAERKKAYERLAERLRDETFFKTADQVMSRSLTLDFAREIEADKVKPQWYDKPGIVWLWLFNLYNWRPKRVGRLVKLCLAREASHFVVSRSRFMEVYERR